MSWRSSITTRSTTCPPTTGAGCRRKQRLYLEEWVHLVDELHSGLTDSDARVLVHAAIGAIQSALFHASGLPDDRLRALLTTAAESILGCASAS